MNEKFIEVQKQIRENQMAMSQYMKEFVSWEKEINTKDNLLKKEVNSYPKEQSIIVEKEHKSSKNKEIKENLKRDGSSIQNYYDQWNKFDVNAEIEEIEDSTNPTIIKPFQMNKSLAASNVKVSVSNNRNTMYDPDFNAELLKRDGISFFKIKNYNKSIEFFTMGLNIKNLSNNNIIFSLYNNRGNCYLKQFMYKEALKDFESAFMINANDLKITYRLAFTYFKLNKFHYCLKVISYANKINSDTLSTQTDEGKLFNMLLIDALSQVEFEKNRVKEKIRKVDNYIFEDDNIKDNPYTSIVDITEDDNGTIIEMAQNDNVTQIKEKLKTPQAPIVKIRNENDIKATVEGKSSNKQMEITIKKQDLINFVDESTTKNITASSFRLAFSNFRNSELKEQKNNFLLSITPEQIPIIFKNDLDKEILKEILDCIESILPNNQDQLIKILSNLSNTNRFSLIVKFLKKDSLKTIFSKFDLKYDSLLITIRDKFYN